MISTKNYAYHVVLQISSDSVEYSLDAYNFYTIANTALSVPNSGQYLLKIKACTKLMDN